MSNIEIRFAQKDDVGPIMEFIDKYWKKGHIMARNQQLFAFQHEWNQEITFVIAEDGEKICGALGYIPYSAVKRDVMLAIWKTVKTDDTMLGIRMLEFLRNDNNTRTVSAPGIHKRTRAAYEYLGIRTGIMRHWYRLGRKDNYRIARINNAAIAEYEPSDDKKLAFTKFASWEEMAAVFPLDECLTRKAKPYKSMDYIKRRYFCHPVYHYLVYGCKWLDKNMLLILRVQLCNHAAVLRMIDCIGDHKLLKYSTQWLDARMKEFDCEYIDCYETGVCEDVFRGGGWSLVSETDNVIPEHFSPFEQQNVDIYYMSEIENVVLFKGDGDMDRPN